MIDVVVERDGSVLVTENITFDFDGHFEGAWRDIPSRFGEQVLVGSVSVSEDDNSYGPGGTTTLGEAGPPETFAAGPNEGGTRIVWRYSADDERRTFSIRYRMVRLIKLYSDTAELNLRAWGDQWATGLGRLTARVRFPRAVPGAEGDRLRVWGHPREVQGVVARDEDLGGATLEATGIPPEQWVEMRLIFPLGVIGDGRSAVPAPDTGTGAAFVDAARISENAFDRILADHRR